MTFHARFRPRAGGIGTPTTITGQLTADQGQALQGLGTNLCDSISNPALRALCLAGVGLIPGGGETVIPTGGGTLDPGAPSGLDACVFPFRRAPDGSCQIFLGDQPGPNGGGGGGAKGIDGIAVMGRFGAALQPTQITRSVLRCPRGSVLGIDDLCYDHLHKRDRKWIPAAKPLLTGGERNAIRIAARAGGKLHKAQKGLKKASRLLAKAC